MQFRQILKLYLKCKGGRIIFPFEIDIGIIWLAIIIICIAVEAVTMGLTTIWFAIGGVVALLLTTIGAPIGVQIFIFLLISSILLYFTRPIAKKWLKIGHEKTNVNSLIGKTGVVLVNIDPINAEGQIKVNGQIWSAITDDGTQIKEENKIKVIGIKGVKLIVKEVEK